MTLANSRERRPHGRKQSHSPRGNRTPCPPQSQTIKKKHPQQPPREPNPNRSPALADKYCAPVPWDTYPTSLNRNRETHHQGSACPGQQHQNQQSQQSPPTSDIADASNSTRDGIQHPFLQVNHSLYMCCRSRCYAPIKRIVPLFHSINTPTKTPSQRGSSTPIHSTGRDCTLGKCSAARWGAERPAKSGVPESNIPGPRNPPRFPHSRRRSQSV